ncbi:phage antirepressor KilAC domain-containing protein [Streptomyces sp. NPDC050504]|uniref:phage antirepressor KilAC domain-containing protein n=1 Tax=Streptomyces sp. NPDC050504 TaxID=3365618 RepID=UPI0037A48FEE
MNDIIPPSGTSPFDRLKQTSPDGHEYWSARELQAAMGYDRWERFTDAMDRAIAAAMNTGVEPLDHFRGAAKITNNARGQQRRIPDFHLTRFAAYLIAMNGDPRKAEIASAQTYFAVQTRKAETAVTPPALPDMATPQGRMAVARLLLESTEREVELTSRVAELEPKALAHDTFMTAQAGDRLVRQAAKELGWRESDLRGFLLDERLIYRRQRTCGGWEYDFYAAHREHFTSVEKVVEHTWGSCAHYTLHLTPRGLSFVQMRIAKRRSEMRAAVEGGAS